MPATPGNALNVSSAGVVSFDGTATFSESSLTQHSVLVGGASQAITSISVGGNNTVLQGTASSDPAFTATPTVTSITFGSGNALNTYVVGTFTPTLVGATTAGTTSYTTQTGNYVQIGKLVFIMAFLDCTTGNTAAGNFQFGGLPATSISGTNLNQLINVQFVTNTMPSWPTNCTMIQGSIAPNSTLINLAGQGSSTIAAQVQIGSSTHYTVKYTGCYQAA